MTVYSYAQMEELWIKAGGPARLAPLAAAIGEAESGGNSDALNPDDNNGTQSSFGIWQISNGTHTPPDPNWANPAVNAQLAVAKWRGAGEQFSPWGTYDSGAYKAYLNGKTTPDPNVPGNPGQQIAQLTATMGANCAVAVPSFHYGIFFGYGPGPSFGGQCLLTKSNARAVVAVATLGAGAAVTGVGLTVLVVTAILPRAAGAARVLQPIVDVTRMTYTSNRFRKSPPPAPQKASATGSGP